MTFVYSFIYVMSQIGGKTKPLQAKTAVQNSHCPERRDLPLDFCLAAAASAAVSGGLRVVFGSLLYYAKQIFFLEGGSNSA